MRAIMVFLLWSLLITSCVSRKAVVDRQQALSHGAVKIEPAWEVGPVKGVKWIPPVVAMSGGAFYGYHNETQFPDGTVYSGAENAVTFGAMGLLAGVITNAILFPKAHKIDQRYYPGHSDKWLRKFNRNTKSNYVLLKKDLDHSLIIIPKDELSVIRDEFAQLRQTLQQRQVFPDLTYADLRQWKNKLERDYSFLPVQETSEMQTLINQNIRKVVDAELLHLAKKTNQDTAQLYTPAEFRTTFKDVFYAAGQTTQQKADEILSINLTSTLATAVRNEIQVIQKSTDLRALHQYYLDLDRKFGRFTDQPAVQELLKSLATRKLNIMQDDMPLLLGEIDQVANVQQLKLLEERYFILVPENNYIIISLQNKIKEKRDFLNEQERVSKLGKEDEVGLETNEELLERAAKGDTEAMLKMGKRYLFGFFVTLDFQEAIKWIERAAERGHKEAIYTAGALNASTQKKLYWLKIAANNKDVRAMNYLALLFTGAEQFKEAFKWYLEAAKLGDQSAMFKLGLIYADGIGIPQNKSEALTWFINAAEKGNTSAMVRVGLAYNEGEGLPQNKAEAFSWFIKAAREGDVPAMYYTARSYTLGEGIPLDYNSARYWLRKIVEVGEGEVVKRAKELLDVLN